MTPLGKLPIFRAAIAVAVLVGVIGALACQSATTDLEIAIAAAESVIGVLSAAGTIPQPVANAVDSYLGDVSQAYVNVTEELASTDSDVVKAQKVVNILDGIAKPLLPPGTPSVIAAAITAVVNAVANLEANMHGVSSALSAPLPRGAYAAANSPKHHKLKVDKAKLAQLHMRALALAAHFPRR